jgi:hypothetical protein
MRAVGFAVGVEVAASQWLVLSLAVQVPSTRTMLDWGHGAAWLGARLRRAGWRAFARTQSQSINSLTTPVSSLFSSPGSLFVCEPSPHVRPAVSSPSGGVCAATGDAAPPRRLKMYPAIRNQCDTQLLCRVEGDVVRPLGPGVQASCPIGLCGRCADGKQTSRPALAKPHRPRLAMARLWYACAYGIRNVGSGLTGAIAETVVKVPQMAESITEGTLKQWSKRASSLAADYAVCANTMQRSATMLSRTRRLLPSRRTRYTAQPRLQDACSQFTDRRLRECARGRHNQGVSRERGGHGDCWTGSCEA